VYISQAYSFRSDISVFCERFLSPVRSYLLTGDDSFTVMSQHYLHQRGLFVQSASARTGIGGLVAPIVRRVSRAQRRLRRAVCAPFARRNDGKWSARRTVLTLIVFCGGVWAAIIWAAIYWLRAH
jgi:hypothetical protein